jgi:hypothetical protein
MSGSTERRSRSRRSGLVRADVDDVMLGPQRDRDHTTGSDNIIDVDNTGISYGKTGVMGLDGSTVRISDSVITQNATGLQPMAARSCRCLTMSVPSCSARRPGAAEQGSRRSRDGRELR